MKILLDACTFLWIASDAPQLSEVARHAFADPANDVFLSAVSTWEIAIKQVLGRLRLPEDPARFIPQQRRKHGIEALSLSEAATLLLPRLPNLHRDPFDRMLVCQALLEGMTLLTPDELIRQYPVPTTW